MAATITDIKIDGKNRGRVSVYLEGRFAFSISLVEAARLEKGQSLDQERIAFWEKRHAHYAAMQSAIQFLSRRPRSCLEMRKHLRTNGVSTECLEAVMDDLIDRGYLDDRKYAQSHVRTRIRINPRASATLRYELKQKGIQETVIDEALCDVDDETMARELVRQRIHRWQRLSADRLKMKIFNYLKYRGFNYEVTKRAADFGRALLDDKRNQLGNKPDDLI